MLQRHSARQLRQSTRRQPRAPRLSARRARGGAALPQAARHYVWRRRRQELQLAPPRRRFRSLHDSLLQLRRLPPLRRPSRRPALHSGEIAPRSTTAAAFAAPRTSRRPILRCRRVVSVAEPASASVPTRHACSLQQEPFSQPPRRSNGSAATLRRSCAIGSSRRRRSSSSSSASALAPHRRRIIDATTFRVR